MKQKAEKCHLLIFGKKSTDVSVQIGAASITESTEEKLLGVTLKKNLDFKNHTLNHTYFMNIHKKAV